MNLTRTIENLFRRYLPSPFTIAVLLTLLTIVLALLHSEGDLTARSEQVLTYWEDGIWNTGLLVFAYQMMLILVLGHILVLSKPVEHLILRITSLVTNSSNAAVLVALPTMLVSFFNWGLGLIFGALLARKVGEYAKSREIPLNYPLIGACGYLGLMVWHGGISGSAPIKAAEPGHLTGLMEGVLGSTSLPALPDSIPASETILSLGNILIFSCVVLVITLVAWYLGRSTKSTGIDLEPYRFRQPQKTKLHGAERLDHSRPLALLFGILIFVVFFIQYTPMLRSLNITPNMLNFFMLGLAIVLHGSFSAFGRAVEEAIGDTAGILIQFPLYFGIMGIMAGSGMIGTISDFFVSISGPVTLPLFTFASAGLVNLFVPSGGGQWAVQGPMVLQSALELGVPLPKAILALSYGDQVTNMLQPFWALPLLAITRLKAKEILPYTLIFMVAGSTIYVIGLLLL